MAHFLIDEDLPASLSPRLRKEDHESAHVIELRLRGSPEPAVFKWAQEHEAVLVSRDLGFANRPYGTSPRRAMAPDAATAQNRTRAHTASTRAAVQDAGLKPASR
jgi:hypothetical protein